MLIECLSHCSLLCNGVVVAGTQKNHTLSKSAGLIFPDIFSPLKLTCAAAHVNFSGEKISGKIKPADFDKVWFFCVPATTTPLHNKEQCERHSININNTISSSSNSAANEETQSKHLRTKTGLKWKRKMTVNWRNLKARS